ncbi:hypothetical protein DFH06DRAFT_1155811 [Mycena polygramma]|nr:hypothetical protein DFH06DRAFT_1155811 [Mycena polygramma]
MSSPSTPKRKRASATSNATEDDNPSPRKTRAPRGSPTKAELRKAAAEAKANHKAEWATWCSQNVWTPDPAYRQRAGSVEMHRATAMGHYRLKVEEIDTLPYVAFANQYHPDAPPGRSYVVADLDRLVYRKFATLNGVPRNPGSEAQFLAEGQRLFDEDTAKLAARSPRKAPTKWRVIRVPS